MTVTFSEVPPVYSLAPRTEQPVNPVTYPTQMRKIISFLYFYANVFLINYEL